MRWISVAIFSPFFTVYPPPSPLALALALQPFAEVCLEHGNRLEAVKYVQKVTPEHKFRLYMSME